MQRDIYCLLKVPQFLQAQGIVKIDVGGIWLDGNRFTQQLDRFSHFILLGSDCSQTIQCTGMVTTYTVQYTLVAARRLRKITSVMCGFRLL